MTDLIPLQFQNKVELWCVSTLRKPLSTLKKIFVENSVWRGHFSTTRWGVFCNFAAGAYFEVK